MPPNIGPNQWHNLKLRFEGSTITCLIDAKPVLTASDSLYPRGMAGLMTSGDTKTLSTSYFDNLLINEINGSKPTPSSSMAGQTPIYSVETRP